MNKNTLKGDANRDKITGEPGSHPVGTGVGAAVGGAAGAAAGATAGAVAGTVGAGPIGAVVGVVAGAVIGAKAGHSTAEGLNPTSTESEGRFIGYAVVDSSNEKVGTVESVWLDGNEDTAYLAIRTGWLGMGQIYVVPAQRAQVSESRRSVRIPYTLSQLKEAPNFDANAQLQAEDEDQIGSYFGPLGFRREGWLDRGQKTHSEEQDQPETGTRKDDVRVQLKEEELKVGKREVEYGGVRLRKIIRTETVNQPIELKREEIIIERVPASANAKSDSKMDFSDEEIYVPLRREEAVISKETKVREEVRIGKRSEVEKQTISETVRKEDVEVENMDSRVDPARKKTKDPSKRLQSV